ncbi:MAG: S8 family peptidase [Chloroflexi bacterium]|nr:S8 family peptidase [Chloroflexota bacterium]
MKRILMVVLVALVLLLSVAGTVSASGNSEGNGPGRYIVVFSDGVNDAAKDTLTARFGGIVEKPVGLLGNANVVFLPPGAVQALQNSGEVVRMEEDAIVYAVGKPEPATQLAQTLPWGIDRVDADLAWPVSTGAGVKVAIIDTGIDKDHPDLVGNIKGGRNFVVIRGKVNPNQWDDDNGHGTHVAGTVAAVNNTIGVIGVAPQASLYAVKVLNRNGAGSLSDVINGIDWAIANGMDIINMSLGTSSDSLSLHIAVDAAYAAGIVVVAAAGNSGDTDPDNDVGYPAKYSSVIAVAATDNTNTRASWSSDGPEVEVSAPGVSVLSTYKGGGYATGSGTSMASPHIAGIAALVLSSPVLAQYDLNGNGIYEASEVRALLQVTADPLGSPIPNNYYGYGLGDALEAVTGTP